MEWQDKYNIGFDLIDGQHQKLVELVTQTEKVLAEGYQVIPTRKALKELEDYTIYHFSSEEQYMDYVKFDELESHKKMHQDFVGQVQSMIMRFDSDASFKSSELIEFMYDWIFKHILAEDMKLLKFLPPE